VAFSGLLALIDDLTMLADDLAALADDVASLTVSATQKTTGIVTDDMAVTAEQALGLARDREIPVVLKVARGSLFNKGVILVPAALILDTVAPWSIGPLLMAGGAYLAFEAVEKIAHRVLPGHDHHEEDPTRALARTDPAAFEALRVSGAIRTDLILSAEIVAITLGQVVGQDLGTKAAVLYSVSIIVTIGVYGIVAGLIKLDDLGEAMVRRGGGSASIGRLILRGTPWLMRAIGWIGAIAMLVVGGHLLLEGIHPVEELAHAVVHAAPHALSGLVSTFMDALVGAVAGTVVMGALALIARLRGQEPAHP
jgi:predicted DNA repair protein MutK